MPCIYPGPHSDQMSVEHPVPYALGRFSGFALLRDRVCRACNTEIGKRTETQFLRAGPTGFFRWLLGVRGRDGLPPSPFLVGAAGVPAMEMPGRLPDASYEVLFEVNPGGSETVQPCRQIVFEHPIAGTRPLRVTDQMRKEPHLLAEQLAELGFTEAKPLQAYAGPDDTPWVTELVVAFGGAPPTWTSADIPAAKIQLATTYTVTTAYLRAIAKIAFHYALTVFPEFTGMEPEFSDIKQFIWDGTGDADRFVRQRTEQFVANFNASERPTDWMHILAARRTYMAITANAQFFAGPRSLPPGYEVYLGRNPARLDVRPETKAHLFVLTEPDAEGPVGVVEDANTANLILPVFNRTAL